MELTWTSSPLLGLSARLSEFRDWTMAGLCDRHSATLLTPFPRIFVLDISRCTSPLDRFFSDPMKCTIAEIVLFFNEFCFSMRNVFDIQVQRLVYRNEVYI